MKGNPASWVLLLLFVYYYIDRWIPLGNWNGQYRWPVQNDQFILDIVVGAALLGAILCFLSRFRPGMVVGTLLLALWVCFHLQAWWIPYFRGVTSPQAIAFHRQFLAHTQVLPRLGNHFPPDAEHAFIDAFVFPAFLICLFASIRSFAAGWWPPPQAAPDRT